MLSSEECKHPDHTEGVYCHERAVACSPDCYCCMEIPPMPSPDPISPADLRPGQRVRVTRRLFGDDGEDCTYSVEGSVLYGDQGGVHIRGHGYMGHRNGPRITQTIEVIE